MLFGAIPPFLLKTDDNPEGVDGSIFEGIKEAARKDRYAWFQQFFDDFNNVDKLAPGRISEQAWQASFTSPDRCAPISNRAGPSYELTGHAKARRRLSAPGLRVDNVVEGPRFACFARERARQGAYGSRLPVVQPGSLGDPSKGLVIWDSGRDQGKNPPRIIHFG